MPFIIVTDILPDCSSGSEFITCIFFFFLSLSRRASDSLYDPADVLQICFEAVNDFPPFPKGNHVSFMREAVFLVVF